MAFSEAVILHILSNRINKIKLSFSYNKIVIYEEGVILLSNDKQDQPNGSNIQVISRAAKILRTLKDHPKGLSLSQISKEVGLARSTVQRIVNSLEHGKVCCSRFC